MALISLYNFEYFHLVLQYVFNSVVYLVKFLFKYRISLLCSRKNLSC